MTGLLGQQYINGKRLTEDIPQRTIFDLGFIVGSFGSGLTPKEFFSHARAGRTSLCDTALTTSQTGYSQRKLIKLMEKKWFFTMMEALDAYTQGGSTKKHLEEMELIHVGGY